MPQFLTRIELHEADESDYKKLHEEMGKRFFDRTIVGDDGHTYELPSATYSIITSRPLEQVRDIAIEAAAKTNKEAWVLTMGGEAAWLLHPIA
ncbi:type V toxin-antitoxin system endoribonuclease antitoxin GhoS [Burkholderia gladioli]|uniref:type V toxin-antitoxin system endoribonuclease antitoxin GhoS n=1 Tax=Burkholderia gladioli TaxID=28095 RepID=UPI000D003BC2|nr:type V toxin-antitoxin system endoribonuclease antitoxin GhoS [Burkholderia gladioli]PRE82357.1 DUF2622 domain-containing protein [Burkholderia gladioli]